MPGESSVDAGSRAFNLTSCKEFEQGARFDPHDVIDSLWRIFYFWAKGMEISAILFSLPSDKKIQDFKEIAGTVNPELEVNWNKSALVMEPRPGVQVLLTSCGHDEAFRALVKKEQQHGEQPLQKPHIYITEVRMKTVNRYLGIINCGDGTAFALARVEEIPTTDEECMIAATHLGLKVLSGKSYLIMKNLYAGDEL
ncbi:unnamed protein product [Parnassius mnemosyne]|uniref:Uncharacterized protein n=1 Tax=Parnassius mnemosyne TaxID=213953 RepID=A0AAV1M962_9NEOP